MNLQLLRLFLVDQTNAAEALVAAFGRIEHTHIGTQADQLFVLLEHEKVILEGL